MKQRLGIAAALLGDPDLLILDEPANGLDPEGVREMRALIGELAGTGRTVLVSSHDLSELEQVCDWLVLIDTGRSLYQGADPGPARRRQRRPRRRAPPVRRPRRAARRCSSPGGSTVHGHGERLVVDTAGADVGDLAADGQPGRVRRRDRADRAQPAAHDARGPLPLDGQGRCAMTRIIHAELLRLRAPPPARADGRRSPPCSPPSPPSPCSPAAPATGAPGRPGHHARGAGRQRRRHRGLRHGRLVRRLPRVRHVHRPDRHRVLGRHVPGPAAARSRTACG